MGITAIKKIDVEGVEIIVVVEVEALIGEMEMTMTTEGEVNTVNIVVMETAIVVRVGHFLPAVTTATPSKMVDTVHVAIHAVSIIYLEEVEVEVEDEITLVSHSRKGNVRVVIHVALIMFLTLEVEEGAIVNVLLLLG